MRFRAITSTTFSFAESHFNLFVDEETLKHSKRKKMKNVPTFCALFLITAALFCSAEEKHHINVRWDPCIVIFTVHV